MTASSTDVLATRLRTPEMPEATAAATVDGASASKLDTKSASVVAAYAGRDTLSLATRTALDSTRSAPLPGLPDVSGAAAAAKPAQGAAPAAPALPPQLALTEAQRAPRAPAPAVNNSSDMPLPNLPALQPHPPIEESKVARAEAMQVPDSTSTAALAGDAAGAGSAQAEFAMAQQRTGLSDTQLAQLQQAQDQLSAGNEGNALSLLRPLNAQLQGESRSYVVQEGESLWHVAGHQEVYGNPYLWPLVWQANRGKLREPYQLYKGMHLSIPAHPTVQEVAQALAYSKSNSQEGMRPAITRPAH